MTRSLKKAALGCLASLFCMHYARATENGQNASPVGVNTVLTGILPAPGHAVYLDYFEFYNADSTMNGSGKNAVHDFQAQLIVNASRFLYTWKPGFDNFHITSGFVLPVVLRASLSTPKRSGNNGGIADITLQPLSIGYVSPDHRVFSWFGVDVFVPTGQYSKSNTVNVGHNYYSFVPDINLTWFASPRLQLSLHGQWEFHTTNTVTDYHSGDIGFVTYAADYAPFPQLNRLHFAIQGYALGQFTNDTQYGKIYNGGYRGQAFAIGPQVRWSWAGGGVALKWQHEFLVRNRTSGDRIWLQFSAPIL